MAEVRDQRPEDAAAVRDVLRDAFGSTSPAHGDQVADLADALLAGPSRVALVAERGGDVVGHIVLSRCWLDARRELVEVLVLSPLGVASAHQRTGVGSALTRAALARAAEIGAPLVFLEGNPDYYLQHGFRRGRELGFAPPSERIPDVAFQVALLPGWQDWMTGAFVYCDVFWQFDLVGLRD